ncbi:MAG: uracil-xanthine permease family protein [Natronospirillum sp.]|uniref:uracil-xanthine permease family protein n=1 Tax=Natronospirillum sp. TaxID=2812955 RepID=UPI0025CD009B|nr:uracil-xanthine permease family protein [Natronospirillum sp.]MCH8552946.1 uracil-xanthine permease family protein [Natronospirillum sp.]
MTTSSMPAWRTPLVGAQMLVVAFGSLVLMPLLTGLDPSVALFTAGVGTLIFHFITGKSVPVFLASSFAFIAPIGYAVQTWGMSATMGALVVTGVLYILLSAAVKWKGPGFLHFILPPVVIGPIIMVIGLSLAPVAIDMAMGETGDYGYGPALFVSMTALIATVVTAAFARGIFRVVPILIGVTVGYMVALPMGMVDLTPMQESAWVALPEFVAPTFQWQPILFMIPVAIAPAVEHVGDVMAISKVTGKDYVRKPGLHRTLLGDGVATSTAALFGGPPNTTYSEVTGAVMLTKMFNPVIMIWAAGFAVVLAFIGKLGAILQTIPDPVMGGILVVLFGSIAAVGMNTLVRNGVDMTRERNLIIVAVTLVFGIGGMVVGQAEFALQGIALCGVVAIVLNLVLPGRHIDNEERQATAE